MFIIQLLVVLWNLSRLSRGIYLVLVCAVLELFQLIIKHRELPGDALYSSM